VVWGSKRKTATCVCLYCAVSLVSIMFEEVRANCNFRLAFCLCALYVCCVWQCVCCVCTMVRAQCTLPYVCGFHGLILSQPPPQKYPDKTLPIFGTFALHFPALPGVPTMVHRPPRIRRSGHLVGLHRISCLCQVYL
jgi:hypothetical protein